MPSSNDNFQRSLAPLFNQSASDARQAFPGKLENLMILLTSMNQPVYVAPAIADHLVQNPAAVQKAIDYERAYLNNTNAVGVANSNYNLAGTIVKLIAMNEDVRGVFSPNYTKEMRSLSTLDHEIGHLVVKNGGTNYPAHLAECAADTYAALRHIQRFGKETDFFEYYNWAHSIVLNLSPIHYTNRAVQKVQQLAQETDITKLSLAETATLAENIAATCCFDSKTLQKIVDAFRPVALLYQENNNSSQNITDQKVQRVQNDQEILTSFCNKTLAVMKQFQNDADIFEAGKNFLNQPLRKKLMVEMAKIDPYFQAVLDFLAPPEKEPHVLFKSRQAGGNPLNQSF